MAVLCRPLQFHSHGGVWHKASAGLCRSLSLAQLDVILSSPFPPRVGLSGPGELGEEFPAEQHRPPATVGRDCIQSSCYCSCAWFSTGKAFSIGNLELLPPAFPSLRELPAKRLGQPNCQDCRRLLSFVLRRLIPAAKILFSLSFSFTLSCASKCSLVSAAITRRESPRPN